jgi:hypothetical protein
MYVVYGRAASASHTKFFFDEQTALLTRLEHYNDVGLGLTPVRVESRRGWPANSFPLDAVTPYWTFHYSD